MTPRRPRLLCVYQHAPTPDAPGIYRHRLLFAELVRRGWDVDLVSTPLNYMTGAVPEAYSRKPYVREEIDGVMHHWVWASGRIHASKGRRALNYATFAAAAGARASSLPRPDVVLVSSPPLSVGAVGPVLGARYRRPWILEVRDVWPESAASVGWLAEESRLYGGLERLAHRLARSAVSVIVPTPGLVPHLLRHGARVVSVVPGGVIDNPPDPAVRAETRAALGISEGTCVFAYIGSVGVANGLDLLVDAVRELGPETEVSVVVVGDGSAKEHLERRLEEERVDRIRLVGAVPKTEVGRYLAASDVCLHLLRPDPTFASALPTKVLEYFGAHRAFLTTVPGLPERLALRSGGGFAPSAPALAAEMRRFAGLTADERRAHGDRAFAFGSERFGIAAATTRLELVLRDAGSRQQVREYSSPMTPSPSNPEPA